MSRKKAPEDTGGQPWLDALEARVQDAVERLTALGSENRRLAERVAELEARLRHAETDRADGEETEGAGAEAGAWRRERDEVRRRVGTLTETLANLLAESGDTERADDPDA